MEIKKIKTVLVDNLSCLNPPYWFVGWESRRGWLGRWGRLGAAHQHAAIQTKAGWAPILIHERFLLTAQGPVPR